MAELRYLQDSIADSIVFWRECRDQLLMLFMDGPNFMLQEAPSGFVYQVFVLLKRVVRFMLCFESELINKNLMLIDAYLLLQNNLEESYKRPLNAFDPDPTNSLRDEIAQIIGKTSPTFQTSQNRSGVGSSLGNIYLCPTAWGSLKRIKNNITQYVNGKISSEDMLALNRKVLRHLGKTQHRKRVAKAKVSRKRGRGFSVSGAAPTRMHRSRSRAGSLSMFPQGSLIRTRSTFIRVQEKWSSNFSFNELASHKRELSQLMYILQVDDHMIFYIPSTGKKRIHRLGGRAEDDVTGLSTSLPNDKNPIHYLSVCLMPDTRERITFAVSSFTTLDTILRHTIYHPFVPSQSSGFQGPTVVHALVHERNSTLSPRCTQR